MIRVAYSLAPGDSVWTGGVSHLRNMARVLSSFQLDRVSLVLFGSPSALREVPDLAMVCSERHQCDWLEARRAPPRLASALLYGIDRVALRAFRKHRIDVAFEAGQYFGWRFPIPCVTWIADFQSNHFPAYFSVSARLRTRLGRRLQMRPTRTLLLSSDDASRDCDKFFPGCLAPRHVVSFAVLPVGMPAPDTSVPPKYGLPAKFLYLPNQFWKHKNHEVVIRALRLALLEEPDLTVAASGNPVDPRNPQHYAWLKNLARSEGVASHFRFLNMISRADLLSLVQLSHAVINPSLFEGWSTTVEEAKALGVPLVLSDISVHREQVRSGAWYFSPTDPASAAVAMVKCWRTEGLSSEDRRREAEPGAIQRAARYSARLATVFESARGSRGSPSGSVTGGSP